jgi:hydrogenase maturation protease
MSTLVLGIGNPILTDDGVGINIAQKLKEERPELEVMETSQAGFVLLDLVNGYDKLIIVDSIKTEQGDPGELYKLDMADLKASTETSCSHGVDIATAFELGRGMGYKVPEDISLYAVEIKDNSTFGEECTEEVGEKVGPIAKQIIEEEKL